MINKKHSASSKRWLKEHFNDKYFNQVQKKKLRSRSWFKLEEIQQNDNIFKSGTTVVDLGSSPGGWSKYAISQLGKKGRVIACDILPMTPILGVDFLQGDFSDKKFLTLLLNHIGNKKVQVVMSDMLPNLSGIAEIDIPRSIHLAKLALDISRAILTIKGSFVVKVFKGYDFEKYLKNVNYFFKKVKIRKPESSRSRSREEFVVATGLIQYPNRY